jgi:Alkylmercury lyase
MPQNVAPFEWTDDALRLRQFVFDFWFAERRPPTLRDAHEAIGLDRRALIQAYKALDLGLVVTVDQQAQNCNLLKAPPFASIQTNVSMFVDDRFHSFIGCAHEALGASNSPQVRGKRLRFDSYCVCCLAPIALELQDFQILSRSPESVLIHVTQSPWDWCTIDMLSMCDATNFVLGPDHAVRYERMVSRRGVLMTLEQAREYISFVAQQRLWDYHWPPLSMDPPAILERLTALGVDVANWML